jgi:tight adherence protein B
MFAAFFVFIVVAGLIVGGYFLVSALPEIMARRRLDERLRDVSAFSVGDSDESVVMKEIEGPLPAVERMMKATRAGSWLKRLIEQSGQPIAPSAVVLMSIGAAVVLGLLAAMFLRFPFAMLLVGAAGGFAPIGFLMNRRAARVRRFEEQFPEALDLLSRAIRAGHAFQTGMGMVADELEDPVGPEFKKTFDQQNFGLPLRDALNELSERVNILDVRFFVTAVLIQRDTGGNLAEILDNLAHVVRERFKIRRQIRVHTAHGRFTAWVLLSLPAALAVALQLINPEHMQLLFTEHMGQVMIVVAIVMQTVGYLWIRQIIKIEV